MPGPVKNPPFSLANGFTLQSTFHGTLKFKHFLEAVKLTNQACYWVTLQLKFMRMIKDTTIARCCKANQSVLLLGHLTTSVE